MDLKIAVKFFLVLYNGARLSCSRKCSIPLRTDIFSEPGLIKDIGQYFGYNKSISVIGKIPPMPTLYLIITGQDNNIYLFDHK